MGDRSCSDIEENDGLTVTAMFSSDNQTGAYNAEATCEGRSKTTAWISVLGLLLIILPISFILYTVIVRYSACSYDI
jgi:hypothetical protein